LSDSEFAVYQRTQMAMIKSRLVLKAALQMHGTTSVEVIRQQTDPVAWLEKSLKVTQLEGTDLVRISLSGRNSADLAILVNAVASAYERESEIAERSSRVVRLQGVQNAFTRHNERLQARRRAHRDLMAALADGSNAFAGQRFLQLKQDMADFSRELTRVRLAKVAAQAELARPSIGRSADEAARKSKQEQLKDELGFLQAKEDLLDKELVRFGRLLDKSSDDLDSMKRDLDQEEQIVKRLQTEIATLEIEMQASPQIAVLDKAAAR
jgi:hypothetical protein